jgi:hypothetical protein
MKKLILFSSFLFLGAFAFGQSSILIDPNSTSKVVINHNTGGSDNNPHLKLRQTLNSFNGRIRMENADGSSFFMQKFALISSLPIDNFLVTEFNGNTLFFIRGDENVGIGTTIPTAKLHVAGDVNITGKINNEAYIAPTLLNNWVNYDVPNGYAAAGYYKDKENRVQLRGLIKDGDIAASTVLFLLPVGYRPASIQIYAVVNGNSFGRVDVYPNGQVQILSGGNAFLSLDGITFRAL